MADKRPAEDQSNGTKNGSAKKPKKATSQKEPIPDVNELDFSNDSKTEDGKLWNFKISSWNVNGIRAWVEKNGQSYIKAENPDIFCVQETKCNENKIPDEVNVDGYKCYWSSGDKEGYAGTGIYSKTEPLSVTFGIGNEDHDGEGRVITAEYDNFYLVTVYVPNAGRGLVRLGYRKDEWDPAFRAYLKKLEEKKPVILCGDLNVAHQPIDLAKPKNNKKNAGFTEEERQGMTDLLNEGYLDTYRELYPEKEGAYTFWTYMMNARGKDIGWRLDYFLISKQLKTNLCDSVIRKEVFGSDHCPISLMMHF